MHACGHDIHTAVQLGVATVLTAMKATLPGTVKFIFQPAEEGAAAGREGGASLMVKEGVLQNPRPQAIFGLHTFSEMPVGDLGYSEGPALSAVRHLGSQDHRPAGARRAPRAVDRPGRDGRPVRSGAADHPVAHASPVTSRASSPSERFMAASATTSFPAEVTLTGTIRTFRPEMSTLAEARLRAILKGVTEAAGATGEVVRYERGAPATINHDQLTRDCVPRSSGWSASRT